jgi:hypothetical protein
MDPSLQLRQRRSSETKHFPALIPVAAGAGKRQKRKSSEFFPSIGYFRLRLDAPGESRVSLRAVIPEGGEQLMPPARMCVLSIMNCTHF